MKKHVFLSRLIVATFLASATFSAVASGEPGKIPEERRNALKELLQAPEGRGMEVHVSNRSGVAEYLRAGSKPLARAPKPNDESRAATALKYVADNAVVFGLRDPQNAFSITRKVTDETSRHHYFFQQHVNGVPVHGAQLRAHFDEDGGLYAIINDALPDIEDTETEAAIDADDALRIAREQFLETMLTQDAPLLEIRETENGYRLVYTIETIVNTVNRWQTMIDAKNGEILRHFKDHHENSVPGYGIDLNGKGHKFQVWERTGRYHLVDVTVPVHEGNEDPLVRQSAHGDTHLLDMLNSEGESSQTIASDSPTSGWDPAGISAIGNGQTAYRYFLETHNRKGIDGRNSSLLFSIHYGEEYDNAFWNGKWMVFGDGGRRFTNLAQCLDVVGHEMSHGVVATTAALEYEMESGALNESMADVFAAMMDKDDWTIGEDCTKIEPGFIRSMSDPHQGLKQQPKHMAEYQQRPNTKEGDWGGVHVNSGIPNRAAYLLAEGLSKEDLGVAIGRRKTGALYYRALTIYLAPRSGFMDLRRALLLSASDLYSGDSSVVDAIRLAFDTVGISEYEQSSEAPGSADGELTPATHVLDFGGVDNGASKMLTLALTNHTDASIDIHDVVIKGAGFSHSFTNTRVAPGESLKGRVTFTGMTEPGTHMATLEIQTGSSNSTGKVDLLATVRKPDASSVAGSENGGGAGSGLLLMLLLALGLSRRNK